MSNLARFIESGPETPLAEGQVLVGTACEHAYLWDEIELPYGDGPRGHGDTAAWCPKCDDPTAVRHFAMRSVTTSGQAVTARWPGCSEAGWWYVQIDRKLVRWAKHLGLKSSHVGLLIALEGYRKTWDAPTWVKYATLASEIGDSEDTISRRVQDMEQLGLIEVDRTSTNGRRGVCRITRKGLTLALAHIAGNIRRDLPGDHGLDEFLRALRQQPQAAAARNRKLRSEQPQVAATKEEQFEEEEVEEEPLTRRDPEDRGLFDDDADPEEAFIDNVIRLFNAVEEPIDAKPIEARDGTICAYAHHAESDWIRHNGRRECGICHPPAVPRLVARWVRAA
ncbi:helix-turn-helix domain-containing protein [Capillimicrobium parvum]|uniref:Uncharacterized protein n=1 Tax=Capillimicrobium parvum TaxID=2884022 RepID=A0A9E6XXA1_9ACTN|nr:helix-turn-helix domain-containing protein [Capillimicrobium parvum]UGS36095.1 hypothetical protein DSM104329_02493 [Capillimicrobium parvum]